MVKEMMATIQYSYALDYLRIDYTVCELSVLIPEARNMLTINIFTLTMDAKLMIIKVN